MADKKKAQDTADSKRGLETDNDALGGDEVQAKFDEAEDKGHFGEAPDPTPNEHYTVAGVTSGKPTPENDAELATKARNATDAGRAGVMPSAKPAPSKAKK